MIPDRFKVAAFFIPCIFSFAVADVLTVDVNGGGDYSAIQPALTAILDGGTINVMEGTYSGPLNRNLYYSGKQIILIAPSGGVTIDCGSAGRAFSITDSGASGSEVHGIDVVGGSDGSYGGAVLCLGASMIFDSCSFTGCSAPAGGAIYADISADIQFVDCIFADNSSTGQGGALYFNSGALSATGCAFRGNSASNSGGAVLCNNISPIFDNCLFSMNETGNTGGGVYFSSGGPSFQFCTFEGNVAGVGGGSIWCYLTTSANFDNCTFVYNEAPEGSAIGVTGFFVEAYVDVRTSILAFAPMGSPIQCGGFSVVGSQHCIIYGNEDGDLACGDAVDNLIADPQFCNDAGNGEYPIQSDSPAADNGWGEWGILVGAWAIGCDETAVGRELNWGNLKARY